MCDFCSKKKPKEYNAFDNKKEFTNDSMTDVFKSIIKGNVLTFCYDAYSADSSFDEDVDIKYCPMCGRSLNGS